MGCSYFEIVLNDFVSKVVETQNVFPFLSKVLWSSINSCYTLFKSETKQNTTLLLEQLLAVTWVLCILKNLI